MFANRGFSSQTDNTNRVLTSTASRSEHSFLCKNLEKLLSVASHHRSTVGRYATVPLAAAMRIITARADVSPCASLAGRHSGGPRLFFRPPPVRVVQAQAYSRADPPMGSLATIPFSSTITTSRVIQLYLRIFVALPANVTRWKKRETRKGSVGTGPPGRENAWVRHVVVRPRCSEQRIRRHLVHPRDESGWLLRRRRRGEPLASRSRQSRRDAVRVYR